MDEFFEMFGGAQVGELVIILLVSGLVFAGIVYFLRWHRAWKKKKEIRPRAETLGVMQATHGNIEQISTPGLDKSEEKPQATKDSIKLGVGNLRCYVVSDIEDYFTTIENPVGNLFVAETSMPKSGQCYLVREWANGFVEDYDPRMVKYESDKTPNRAYFATHWSIVSQIFQNTGSFWDRISPWWVVGMAGTFIFIAMLVFGG